MSHYLHKHRHVFTDNSFTSVDLAEDLLQADTYLCGTTRGTRSDFPKALANAGEETDRRDRDSANLEYAVSTQTQRQTQEPDTATKTRLQHATDMRKRRHVQTPEEAADRRDRDSANLEDESVKCTNETGVAILKWHDK